MSQSISSEIPREFQALSTQRFSRTVRFAQQRLPRDYFFSIERIRRNLRRTMQLQEQVLISYSVSIWNTS